MSFSVSEEKTLNWTVFWFIKAMVHTMVNVYICTNHMTVQGLLDVSLKMMYFQFHTLIQELKTQVLPQS